MGIPLGRKSGLPVAISACPELSTSMPQTLGESSPRVNKNPEILKMLGEAHLNDRPVGIRETPGRIGLTWLAESVTVFKKSSVAGHSLSG